MASQTTTQTLSDVLQVDAALVYLTDAACAQDTPTSSLVDVSDGLFRGSVRVEQKTPTDDVAAQHSCQLRLNVVGDLMVNAKELSSPFDVLSALDASVGRTVATNLPEERTLDALHLSSSRVKVSNKDYALSILSGTTAEGAATQLTLRGPCGNWKDANVLKQLLPVGTLLPDTASTAAQNECSMRLNVRASAETLEKPDKAFEVLKTIDSTFEDALGGWEAKVDTTDASMDAVAPMQLNLAEVPRGTFEEMPAQHLNAPTKEITLGILVGISMLCAMLFFVNQQRRTLDKQCRERYEKASRAAQIHRVSIRMGYDKLLNRDVDLEYGEEEEKEELL